MVLAGLESTLCELRHLALQRRRLCQLHYQDKGYDNMQEKRVLYDAFFFFFFFFFQIVPLYTNSIHRVYLFVLTDYGEIIHLCSKASV